VETTVATNSENVKINGLGEKESILFRKIIRVYTENEEEVQQYMGFTLDRKLEIINHYLQARKSIHEVKVDTTESVQTRLRRGTFLNTSTTQEKMKSEDVQNFEKIARSLAKSEDHYKELMGRPIENKYKLISTYHSIVKSINAIPKDDSPPNISSFSPPKTLELPKTRQGKTFFKRIFSSGNEPDFEPGTSPSLSPRGSNGNRNLLITNRRDILKDLDLTTEEEKIYMLYTNILSAGDQDKFELYENMSNEQKHDLLKQYN
jgi:hypothetical protein